MHTIDSLLNSIPCNVKIAITELISDRIERDFLDSLDPKIQEFNSYWQVVKLRVLPAETLNLLRLARIQIESHSILWEDFLVEAENSGLHSVNKVGINVLSIREDNRILKEGELLLFEAPCPVPKKATLLEVQRMKELEELLAVKADRRKLMHFRKKDILLWLFQQKQINPDRFASGFKFIFSRDARDRSQAASIVLYVWATAENSRLNGDEKNQGYYADDNFLLSAFKRVKLSSKTLANNDRGKLPLLVYSDPRLRMSV